MLNIMFAVSCFIGYLFGSIPFGLILTKLAGLGDIRKVGSGNIGATNVLRTGNKKLAALVLLLDGLKGWAAVFFLAQLTLWVATLFANSSVAMYVFYISCAVGLSAILGHVFPVWLKFKGGKGVATSIGVLLALSPPTGFALILIWLAVFLIARISSLAAITAFALAPLYPFFTGQPLFSGFCLAISLLVIYRHKDNIRRLLKGEEPKFGKK